ncbi:hypothetical protein ACQUSR_06020 [Streptomyces sp. P1-3]|uniref:hypothetical protein n=1 Tax=Streptomyces sp. P1-3 TaxID=3421658 RepID=UPI003D369D59
MGKRERWFDEGAPLLRQTIEGFGGEIPPGDFYMCPCCMIAYPREALAAKPRILTVEHVPPKRLRGHGLLLTCSDCNSTHGSKFDAQAIKRQAMEAVGRGEDPRRNLRATFIVNGIEMPCVVSFVNGRWVARATGTHPENADAHAEALQRARESGDFSSAKFIIREEYDPARANVSWIRSAYLAAFIALGWGYVFQSTLSPVRDQLKDPDPATFQSLTGNLPDQPAGGRKITIIERPEGLMSVAVVIDRRVVFLPDPWGEHSWDHLSQAVEPYTDREQSVRISGNGLDVPWPIGAENRYRLDKI